MNSSPRSIRIKQVALIATLVVIGVAIALKVGVAGGDGIVVKKVEPIDSEILEEWKRVTDDEDVRGASASKTNHPKWKWQVSIAVAEFIRDEPLESTLVDQITSALGKVEGVETVVHEDREVWIIEGEASGEALVRAASIALDSLAAALKTHLESL